MTMSFISFVLCTIAAILAAVTGRMVNCAFMFLLALANLFFVFNDLDSGRYA